MQKSNDVLGERNSTTTEVWNEMAMREAREGELIAFRFDKSGMAAVSLSFAILERHFGGGGFLAFYDKFAASVLARPDISG